MVNRQYGIQQFVGEAQCDKGYIHRQAWVDAIAVSATALKALTATSASVTTNIVPSAQPDYARKVSVTPGGTTADVASGNYVVTGTDVRGATISSTLVFAANATTKQVTDKAFKTITGVLCPIQDGAGATFSIGVEDALGLDRCMSEASVLDVYADGVRETTAATVTFDPLVVSKNTIDPNTALNAAIDFSVFIISTELTD